MKMEQDLFLLQLLKIPVFVIKFIFKTLAIATYVPNYLFVYLVDYVLFNENLEKTLFLYSLTWTPKLVLLVSAFALFAGEFYLIFTFLDLQKHGLAIQITGIILALAGLLILMRKGYLSMIEKFNLTKLKSIAEHIEKAGLFIVDIFGILLAIINTILVINMFKTFSYDYLKDRKYAFIKHIVSLIRLSLIEYLQFFYVKIFFKIFPWRFLQDIEAYTKQKSEKNVLNCLVLLTLIYLNTVLDLTFIILFGLPNIIYLKRQVYCQNLKKTPIKWKVTIKHFAFVVAHFFQLSIELFCTIFCWQNGKKALMKLLTYDDISKLFGIELRSLIVETSLKIPYFIANAIIFASVYKYKKKNHILNKKQQQKIQTQQTQQKAKKSYLYITITFKCCLELLIEIFFYPLIIMNTVMKPWKYWWVCYMFSKAYTLDLKLIFTYFIKGLLQMIFLPFSLVLTVFTLLYQAKKCKRLYTECQNKIDSEYLKMLKQKNKSDQQQATIVIDRRRAIIQKKSLVLRYFAQILAQIIKDLPYLPGYFFCHATLLTMYQPSITPREYPNLIKKVIKQYYHLRVSKSKRFNFYNEIALNMKASGDLKSIGQELTFWRYSYKCQFNISLQKILIFVLPTRSVQKIKAFTVKEDRFSALSNEYWYQNDLSNKFMKKLLTIIVQIIITVIGFVFMLPLTLWRMPTFIILYKFHNSKYFFFKILFKVYKQLFFDIITLPIKLILIIIAPISYVKFIYHSSFKYGAEGIEKFDEIQRLKRNFLFFNILFMKFIWILLFCCVVTIYAYWIRIRQLRNTLRQHKMKLIGTFIEFAFKPVEVTMEQIVKQLDNPEQLRANIFMRAIEHSYFETLKDIPYLLLTILIFIVMPWRINYIIQTLQDLRDDSNQRKTFFKFIKNALRDYACIGLNIILFLSIIKTKKAFILMIKNYRLNFSIGFLEYSYYNELINEIKHLGGIYSHIFYFIMAALFGWTKINTMLTELNDFRKIKKIQKENSDNNKKIYENTIKSGKELQTLNKMGYYNYISVCSFLGIKEIIKLRQVDKFNYMMTKRQEIWFVKWQQEFTGNSEQIESDYQLRCKTEFINTKSQNQVVKSYETIIMSHFIRNVNEEDIKLPELLASKLSVESYQKIFKNYDYSILGGYGPQAELPQEQNEDPQYLRLTMQVRRPKVDLIQNVAWLHLLYIRSNEFMFRKAFRFFNDNQNRKKKQALFLVSIISFVVVYLMILWFSLGFIFTLDSLVGVKILFIFYVNSYIVLTVYRFQAVHHSWATLHPFDIKQDIRRFIRNVILFVRDRLFTPSKNVIKKCYEYVSSVGQKIKIKTIQYSNIFYDEVIKPVYIAIADVLSTFFKFFTKTFISIINSFKSLIKFFLNTCKSFFLLIQGVFTNLNQLYYFILSTSMGFCLKFGLLGNLVFTIFGLCLMTFPSMIWWWFYSERWYLIVSTIHSMVLIVTGYKHLNKIKIQNNLQKQE